MHNSDQITDLPNHVGIILDGNRRWAKARGLPSLEGHRQGGEVFKQIVGHAFNSGINYVSAYVFSAENSGRSRKEVSYLMDLVTQAVGQYLEEFDERGIKIVILGRRSGLRRRVLAAIKRAEQQTMSNTNGTLALCFNYGGHEEIVDAANQLLDETRPITPENLYQTMYEPDIPDIDLIIRTSGEQRLSGFMLWRASYAELFFSPVMWPAFTTDDFDSAINDYKNRTRRLGK